MKPVASPDNMHVAGLIARLDSDDQETFLAGLAVGTIRIWSQIGKHFEVEENPMSQRTSDQGGDKNGAQGLGSVADELRRESDRLRQLAEELQAREEAQAEMQANYPHFKQAVYASLREKFERELAPLPDKDLETLAAEEGAQPLEGFIDELERKEEGP
jgi:hypothetical protein